METKITATELSRALSDILNRVRYKGEWFIVERNGEPIATIAPVSPRHGITLREFLMRYKDFPRPDDKFADDLEAIQASQSKASFPQWPS